MLTLSPITPVTCRPDHLRMLHQVTLHRHKRLQQELVAVARVVTFWRVWL